MLFKKLFVVIFVFFGTPSPALNSLEDFVVASPENQTWIISDSSDLLDDFDQNIVEEGSCRRIDRIAEHEIVEDHETHLRSQPIKLIRFVLTSSPQANHVKVGPDCILKKSEYFFGICKARIHHVRRNIVGSFTVDFISIDL